MADYIGKIAWLSKTEGYGFIGYKGRPDLFCDFKRLQVEGYLSLREGEAVEFDVDESAEGSQAVNVKRLD